jgi:hypothetical protein
MADNPNADRMNSEEYAQASCDVKESALGGYTPSETPRAIVLAGQSGAGKSVLTRRAEAEFEGKGGAVVIDPDDLRIFHTRYLDHVRDDPQTAADRVHPDASKLADYLRVEATKQRYNLIIDGTLKNPENAEQLCKELKAAGYRVEVWALAVNCRDSQRGVYLRYEEALADPSGDEIPRNVPEAIQLEAYDGMPRSIKAIEHAQLADRVSVYRRGDATPIYSNSDTAPGDGHDATAMIDKERQRALEPDEKVLAAEEWDRIEALASRPGRNATPEEKERYATLRREACASMREDPEASVQYDGRGTWGRKVTECHRVLTESRQTRDYDPAARTLFDERNKEMEHYVSDASQDRMLANRIPDEAVAEEMRSRVASRESHADTGAKAQRPAETQAG